MTNTYAEKELERAFDELFSKLVLLPQNKVASIHSAERTEDGGLLVICDCEDGSVVLIRVTPGQQVTVHVN
jgi:hypothetical protein